MNVEINNTAAYGYDVRRELVGEKGSVVLPPKTSRKSTESSPLPLSSNSRSIRLR